MEDLNRLNKMINHLTKAQDVQELAKRLQKILRPLVYHASQSESVVNDTQEAYRGDMLRDLKDGKDPM